MTPKEAVIFSKWSSYIYHVNDTISSLQYCGGECYFRKHDPCHFYVFHEETCYLGNFDSLNEIVTGDPTLTNIYMNTGK